MTVSFLDPRAEPGLAATAYLGAVGARLDSAITIGLLANGFADSGAFLCEVATALSAQLPNATFKHYAKPNPSLVASDALVAQMVDECDAVVGAYGH